MSCTTSGVWTHGWSIQEKKQQAWQMYLQINDRLPNQMVEFISIAVICSTKREGILPKQCLYCNISRCIDKRWKYIRILASNHTPQNMFIQVNILPAILPSTTQWHRHIRERPWNLTSMFTVLNTSVTLFKLSILTVLSVFFTSLTGIFFSSKQAVTTREVSYTIQNILIVMKLRMMQHYSL